MIVVFRGALGGLGLAALVVVLLLAPPKAHPPCSFAQPCPPPRVPRQVRGTVWRSSLGFQLEYSSGWSVGSQDSDGIVLTSKDFDGVVKVAGRRSTDYRRLYKDEIGSLKSKFNLTESTDEARAVVGPNVGYQSGVGADYCGNTTSNQGGAIPVDTVAMAASKDGVSAFVALVSADCKKTDNDSESPLYDLSLARADQLLNTFSWPSQVP
jgi:hypothetical protein